MMLQLNSHRQTLLIAKMFLLFAISFMSFSVFAASDVQQEMNWGVMTMQLFGGLALFLFGMDLMSIALKAVAGDKMKIILRKLTSNRFMGAATGAAVTAVIQSSSVTTVLVVGFISANLMTMSQSVGVIMGANIGTTITAQIVAFKVTKAAFLMIAIGYGMQFSPKNEKIKHYGRMIMGLGMIFYGMSVMSSAMQPLRTYQPFLDLMISMDNPIVGIAVAAVFTGLIQSSSATTGIVIVMASQGFISLPAGIALAFGANIGTCVTAMLASIGKPREAVRAAAVHVFFNIAGVLLWVMFIDQLADFVRYLSPAHPELTGLDKLGAETPRQIANAHTIFNLANTFIFIWFTTQIASLVMKLLPDKPTPIEEEGLVVEAKYLDEYLINTPSLALDRVRLEVLHMGEIVNDMTRKIMPAILDGSKKTISKIESRDDEVDLLYELIVDYLGQISKQNLTDLQTEELLELMEAVGDLENIGDTIETNLVALGMEHATSDFTISAPTRKVLTHFHEKVYKAVDGAIQAVSQNNVAVAQMVIDMKDDIANLATSAAEHQAERLVVDEPNRIAAYTTEIDIIEKQKRIYYFAKRMAKTVIKNKNV
ncbi:MAG: Na/Pi cotransporter family protein [gamma proteobacterium symbiont of Bathyaustriella thionipta]|nr:Na/Pi cotransporter family protein [gamma proteobacterium symbiont of Bathyaustriella thionipta]MCU7950472.1 Na/Pi cotransporter family protein [gamma proteobacterium symbiont of Bathyaustriella thionipta]MCU7954662.1 Na/Pi cotransporter family protein [gamma proteobacterium symbiont of Bathyaustriella thionipta]MCU7957804.1 Na/Pi cotransporter family protein [gamma proteobacterium symbiont of Bathyaustriella thionipta]